MDIYRLGVIFLFFYFPFSFLLLTIISICKKTYLNRYYKFSEKNGEYFLHFSPVVLLFFARKEKYFRIREEAVLLFQARLPNVLLKARTSTLQRYYEEVLQIIGTPISMRWWEKIFFDIATCLFITFNIANLRPYKWYFPIPYMFILFKRVFKTTPKVYIIK